MSPIDQNIVEKKIASILKEVEFLNTLLKEDIGLELRNQYALLHALQNALTAAIDIAQHIVCQEMLEVPDSYADAILKLSKAGFLEMSFARRFSEAARFRNKLVHAYEEIDFSNVLSDLPSMLRDLKEFSNSVSSKL